MSGYSPLTREQRYQMHALMKTGQNQTQMATVLGVHKATISRELRRHRRHRGYRPRQAHCRAQARQVSKRRPRFSQATWGQVEELWCHTWSPEQIRGRLKHEHGLTISHEWIYQHIYHDNRAGGALYRFLRCQKVRRKRYGTYSRRGRIPAHVSIERRPAVVNTRQRIGDWEGDTIIGKGQQGAMVTLGERRSKDTVARGVRQKTASAVRAAVAQSLRPHKARVHTITYDNGREFSDQAGMALDLNAAIYFAHPYASWERGVIENPNGLLRQFFPKARDLTQVSPGELAPVLDQLNHRPRKTLGFRTPHEVFFATTTSLTVALTS